MKTTSSQPGQLDIEATLAGMFAGDTALVQDPYPFYRRLRAEAPAVRVEPVVAISRYEDIVAALRDPVTFSSSRLSGSRLRMMRERTPDDQRGQLERMISHESLYMNETDAPDHTRLRALANYAFTPRRIAAMREQIQRLIDDLLATAALGTDEIDLVESLAYPLPYLVIATLLGGSAERADDIRRWSAEIGRAIGTDYSNLPAAFAAFTSFREYLQELMDERRDSPQNDLLSILMTAEEEGARLTPAELESMFVLLLFAGHETTTHLIGNSMVALCHAPEQMRRLREDPALTPGAVEEFLRYCNSVQFIHRTATQDVTVAGLTIRPGETVRMMIGAANRDEAVFPRAEELDVTRAKQPRHIGFGYGVHVCLGAWLARNEVEMAIATLLARYPDIELIGDVVMRPNLMLAGPQALRLRVTAG
jgi:cytochrome P450